MGHPDIRSRADSLDRTLLGISSALAAAGAFHAVLEFFSQLFNPTGMFFSQFARRRLNNENFSIPQD
jgi:hypothetical protein